MPSKTFAELLLHEFPKFCNLGIGEYFPVELFREFPGSFYFQLRFFQQCEANPILPKVPPAQLEMPYTESASNLRVFVSPRT
jgi:hypothetical protein